LTSKVSRAEVIDYLVAVAVKAGKTPSKVGFADFIINKCSSKFGYDKYRAKSFIDTLINAWNDDKWKTYVQNNPYLTEQEKAEWTEKYA
jgi:hypothetical protein